MAVIDATPQTSAHQGGYPGAASLQLPVGGSGSIDASRRLSHMYGGYDAWAGNTLITGAPMAMSLQLPVGGTSPRGDARTRFGSDMSVTFDGSTGTFWAGGRRVSCTPAPVHAVPAQSVLMAPLTTTAAVMPASPMPGHHQAVVATTAEAPITPRSLPMTTHRLANVSARAAAPGPGGAQMTTSPRLVSSPRLTSVQSYGLGRHSKPVRLNALGPGASVRAYGGRAYQHVPTAVLPSQPQQIGVLSVHKAPDVVPADARYNPILSARRGTVVTKNIVSSYAAHTDHL
eukprot:TRINITY_DN11205_c0_g1_i1.p1 TRINITY_DN11205_c0_g1~~TRINITY_DN11205_c0_g1_i1.p1  ORF type:complete len:287 (+),score=19.93 TRINITY_DN11205_c0_g1_i1:93-953(+)